MIKSVKIDVSKIRERIIDLCEAISDTSDIVAQKAKLNLNQLLLLRHELLLETIQQMIHGWIKTHDEVLEEMKEDENSQR